MINMAWFDQNEERESDQNQRQNEERESEEKKMRKGKGRVIETQRQGERKKSLKY